MSQTTLRLTIVSQEGQLLDQQVERVNLLTATGRITILPNHQPILGQLRFGNLTYQRGEEENEVVVTQGFFHKTVDKRLVVVVDSAFEARSESAAKIKAAIAQAQSSLRLSKDKKEMLMLEASLKQLFWELQLENAKRKKA